MSKRSYYPQQHGERKKAKLNVTISDHNFPLSQNNDKLKNDNHAANWGDDNDDEILLLASQACEVSILRTQLKTSQAAADNARLEKIKVQERVQMEWTDKLTAANNQLQDLMTQLDFKNLEITSIKEKCRMLESSKVKLTQVTVAKNDITTSHKHNSSIAYSRDGDSTSSLRLKKLNSASKHIQTENQNKAYYYQVNLVWRSEQKKLIQILPLTIEPTIDQHSLLDYNEKLQRTADIPNGCKVFSTFHRIPNTPNVTKTGTTKKVSLNDIHEDLAIIAADRGTQEGIQSYLNVFKVTRSALKEVEGEIETLAFRTTTAFHREMDEKYIEATSNFNVVSDEDLIRGKPLYREEQAITARRVVATMSHVLENSRAAEILSEQEHNITSSSQNYSFIEIITSICVLIDKTSCAVLYSGLLTSLLKLLDRFLSWMHTKSGLILEAIKSTVKARPMLPVACEALRLLRRVATSRVSPSGEPPKVNLLQGFCSGTHSGDLRLDYEQGVLLYKNDSCFLQVLMKQIESALRCIERQKLKEQAVTLTRDLVLFCADLNVNSTDGQEKSRCGCWRALLQVAVAALRLCAIFATTATRGQQQQSASDTDSKLLSVCRGGLQLLYQCALRDTELCPLLGYNEGHLIEFCEILRTFPLDELHSNMVAEVASAWQTAEGSSGHEGEAGGCATSPRRQPWLSSFHTFLAAD
ncbi:unnamed protein product, partial [Iphiclides podalirius]